MTAPKEIIELVERFTRNRDEYHAASYNEAQVRKEFIDPFFEALGWDMANRKGKDEEHKDVIRNLTHKDRTGGSKAPDYTLRIGGVPKFFLEAKKPAVDIKNAPEPAYQLRRYAWSAKLPLSLLTNFDCLALYDTRIRPRQNDKPSAARIRSWDLREYAEKWDEIRGLFNPDEIEKGSLRPLIESAAGRRGTSEVDAEFLSDIEKWREDLAHNIARNNRRLSVDDLNNAVQRTIDRIIFLRMCEDRGIEPYGQLQRLVDNGYIYSDLLKLYERADKRYNSGLFHFEHEKGRGEPDTLTPSLKIENDILKKIIGGLYYPDCPYEFSVLPAEILGNVYEQFLGKVIRLTATHQARVEEKPEVKKAGGVYYTPKYIVDYIVKNTVGKLCEGKSPKQIEKLRILDPACGSGSFLLGAYTRLLDYHRDWYAKRWPKQFKKEMYRDKLGQLRLATAEKKRILLNNIYGVDIDPQAVEVTKLSLLLKILQDENAATLEQQRLPLNERALPDLDNNIKCGNSLIGTDFGKGDGQGQFFKDTKAKSSVNLFDWEMEFADVLGRKNPGFDCVIGNPPWGQKEIDKNDILTAYLRKKYPSIQRGIFDLFRPFTEAAIRLTRNRGHWGFVLPDIILLKDYPLTRAFILQNIAISGIAFWGMAFAEAVIDAVTIVGQKEPKESNRCQSRIEIIVKDKTGATSTKRVKQAEYISNDEFKFNLFCDERDRRLIDKLKIWPTFSDVCEPHEGVHSGNIRDKLFIGKRKNRFCVPLIFGREEVQRYRLTWLGKYLNQSPGIIDRERGEYGNIGKTEWYAQPKLIIRRTGDHLVCSYDKEGFYFSNNVFVAPLLPETTLDIRYLLGLLNSKLMTWFYLAIQPRKGRVFAEVKIKHIQKFPIRSIDFRLPDDKRAHDKVVELVERMLALHKQLAKAKGEQERTVIQRQIDSTDAEIDKLIYELYGLTDKEIAIVEGK